MSVRLTEIVRFLETLAPPDRAADWDNVGLIVGDRDTDVHRLLTCLTVTPTVAEEAVARHADLIVTHHPMLFRPVQKLTSDTPSGRSLLRLIQGNVAVYSPHTAFDNCVGGINELLAQQLGLLDVVPLRPYPGRRQVKLVVFVPDKDLAPVMDAVFASGAGVIGNYRECSYRLAGRGTFFGTEAANPTLGQKGRREEGEEWRL
ncbi:MAG: Nif3-like dinuclear metal center hexameric protein, partial [Gemmataceae bacterium]|nr:Nif3-like dinuclear metal center hexameric protein [Gemmataceae bacterium]